MSSVKKSTKLFFSGVLILTITNIVVKIIGLLFKFPMNNYLGTTVMGYYNQSYSIYTVLYMISTAGLPIAVSRLISEARSKGRFKQAKRIYRTALGLFVVIGIIGMLIMLLGAKWYSTNVLSASNAASCIMMIAPTLFFICISSAFRGYFQGYQEMLPTAISQFIEAACKLAIGLALAMYAKNQGEPSYIIAAYAAVGLTVGAALGMIFLWLSKLRFKEKKYNEEILLEIPEDDAIEPYKKICKTLLIIAIPITISASVMSFTQMVDSALISNILQNHWLMSEETVESLYGSYTTQAVSITNMPPVLVYPISYAIIPLIVLANNSNDQQRSKRLMESSLRVSILIGMPCFLGCAVMSQPILSIIFTNGVELSAPLLRLLSPTTLFICMLSVSNAILQANGYERLPLISMLCGAVVKIGTSLLLLNLIGINGTPISTVLCYLTINVLNFYFVAKKVKILPHFGRVFFRPFLASAVCAGSAFLCNWLLGKTFMAYHPRIMVILAIVFAALIYFICIFLFKAITREDLEILPKSEKIIKILKKLHLVKG